MDATCIDLEWLSFAFALIPRAVAFRSLREGAYGSLSNRNAHREQDLLEPHQLLHAQGYLTHFDWGCMNGVHTGWAVIEADNEVEARLAVPPLVRGQARIVKVTKLDATMPSTDRRIEICKAYGCRILHREFVGYREQKAFAVKQATNDWVFLVDADEEVCRPYSTSLDCTEDCDGFYIRITTVLWDQVVRIGKRHIKANPLC